MSVRKGMRKVTDAERAEIIRLHGEGKGRNEIARLIGRAQRLLREVTYLGTAFGPESVRVHEVSAAVSLGHDHIGRAFTIVRKWAPSDTLPAERRSGFWIELARARCGGAASTTPSNRSRSRDSSLRSTRASTHGSGRLPRRSCG